MLTSEVPQAAATTTESESLKTKNSVRMAKYYRSPSLVMDEFKDNDYDDQIIYNIPVPPTESAIMESRVDSPLLSSSSRSKIQRKSSKIFIEDEATSKQGHPHGSVQDILQNHGLAQGHAYSLPANYEYPELVSSLKSVYRELFITSCLYLLNISSAVGIVLVNKLIYSHYKFPYGFVLTLYHFVLTSIGLQILALLKMFPIKPVEIIKVLPLSVSFCSYVVLTNLSLQYNSGTFYQVIGDKKRAYLSS